MMLPRLIDSALLREWTVQSFIVHQTILVLASGMVVLQKKKEVGKHFVAKIISRQKIS